MVRSFCFHETSVNEREFIVVFIVIYGVDDCGK
jgi:hypothetical protein